MMSLHTLPKAELHCHLDGIADPAMLREIVQADPDFPLTPDALDAYYPVHDYTSFWHWWGGVRVLKNDLLHFAPILISYIERLKPQNVRYLEVMIPSSTIPGDPALAVEKVAALRERITQAEAGLIQVEFLVAFGRNRPPEYAARLGEILIALRDAGLIVGAGLAGVEDGYPVKPFAATLARLHDAGLKIEIHGGEWCGPESVWDALEHGYPDRIGHGVHAFEDERLVETLIAREIHLEFCPTSNVITGSVPSINQHPIRRARDLGMSFSVSTDDPGPLGCSMNGEYNLLSAALGFTEADFARIYAQSLAARFQPELRIAAL